MKNEPVVSANNIMKRLSRIIITWSLRYVSYVAIVRIIVYWTINLNYLAFGVLRVYIHILIHIHIQKDKGKRRPVGVPYLFDITIKMLLKLVMEPYIEPLCD